MLDNTKAVSSSGAGYGFDNKLQSINGELKGFSYKLSVCIHTSYRCVNRTMFTLFYE